jgi:hypothetical protein
MIALTECCRHRLAPIAASLWMASVALAAPPKVDFLYPAGGSRGSIVTVDVGKGVDP